MPSREEALQLLESWVENVGLRNHMRSVEAAVRWYARRAPITVMFRDPRKALVRPLVRQSRNTAAMRAVPGAMAGVRGRTSDEGGGSSAHGWRNVWGSAAQTLRSNGCEPRPLRDE